MSTLKRFTTKLSKFLPASTMGGWSPRLLVTAARPLQCKKNEESSENEKAAAESIKNAADSVSGNVKKVSDKASETADAVKEKAKEMITLGAAKVATEVVKKKREMKEDERKNKK